MPLILIMDMLPGKDATTRGEVSLRIATDESQKKSARLGRDMLMHIQQTNDQYNLPKIGKSLKYKGNREGIVERFPEASVQKTIEVDLELIAYDDSIIRKLEWHILKTAKAHDATAWHILHSIPGIGKILSLVILYEVQDIRRFSRP